MADKPETDPITGTETTGHEWDGIKELNTPLPRWWLNIIYLSIIWAIGYWIAMPSWPLVSDYTRGVLGYSDRAAVQVAIDEAHAAQSEFRSKISALSVEEVLHDDSVRTFAIQGGRAAFAVNCSQCHGLGASGSKGYPNLNDDDWLWGGKIDTIHETILYGIRSDHDDTRVNDMPAFLRDEILDRTQVINVAEYVYSLSQSDADAAMAKQGAEVFENECAACHDEKGTGIHDLGAPNLADAIWLYGGDRDTIINTISYSRGGVMPAWNVRLDDVVLKQLAVYVHTLGGGE